MDFDKKTQEIRELIPQLNVSVHDRPLIYLDNAATTPKCQAVIDRMTKHLSFEVANVHRGIHYLSSTATSEFEKTRDKTKEFINAEFREEIIFTKGTTDGINLVASSLCSTLNSGDLILCTEMEHHSNFVPWQIQANLNGLDIDFVKVTDRGELDLEDLKEKLKKSPKLLAINHISNTLGTINPVKEIIEVAHQAGAKVLVDAAQSIPHTKIDVRDFDCDFLVFSAHKLFGPTGFGILYGKKEVMNQLPPYQGGGAMISEVSTDGTSFNELPEKFEAGTPPIAEAISFYDAMEFIDQIGYDWIEAKEKDLFTYADKLLKEIPELRMIGDAKEKTSVFSFVIEGAHPHDLGTLLDEQGIAIRTGHHCTQPLMKRFGVPATARASFSFYNTKEEIDLLIAGLKKAMGLLL